MFADRSHSPRRARAAVLVAALALVGVVAPLTVDTTPADAQASSTITIEGRGWGHGRGLGQYGARGYASGHATGTPWSSAQILNHYYGGTTNGLVPANSTVSVWLKTRDGDGTRFFTKSGGFTVGGLVVPAGSTARIVRDGNQWRVHTAPGCGQPETFSQITTDPAALPAASAENTNNLIRICDGTANGKPYRGFMSSVLGDGIVRTVNTVLLEDYLRGVVPDEMPASWEAAAVQAQAVAARSYALAQGGPDGKRWAWAKTCDDIFCQVYNGVNAEEVASDAAIAATARQVRVGPDGKVRSTEFSSSTGGHTVPGTFTAVPDAGDSHPSNPNHTWTVTLDRAAIASKYALGTLESIRVTQRNGLGADGGRVTEMRLEGSANDVTVSGNGFRSAMGLKSDWFRISSAIAPNLNRIAGADRFDTAAQIAKSSFTSSGVALIARGDGTDSFADGLAANFLAGVLGAPTLLANTDSVPQVTIDTLKQLGVEQVRLLGGPAALSANVESALSNAGFSVQRIAGDNRYATAAAIARAADVNTIGTPNGKRTAVLSSGTTFPDALAAGGIVFGAKVPQLLTDPATLAPETASALTDLGIKHVLITGGPAAVSAAVESAVQQLGITTQRAQGATRYDTAIVLADLAIDLFGFPFGHLDIATGLSFPDALVGGPHAGKARAGIVLTTRDGGVPTQVCSFLRNRAASTTTGHIYGGTAAISDAMKSGLENCLAR